jgi:uncharacterized protein YndB with AHSA1/START domain
MQITVETKVAASIEKVWSAYTSPKDIMKWNAATDDWHTTAAMENERKLRSKAKDINRCDAG